MKKCRLLLILTFIVSCNRGVDTKSDITDENAPPQKATEVGMEAIGKKYRLNSFYDFEHWNLDERLDLVKTVQALRKTSSNVDWDGMRDNYISAIHDLEIDRSFDQTMESKTRRRLLGTEYQGNRILPKKGKKMKKKKKYKSKKKNKGGSNKTTSPTGSLGSSAPTLTSMPTASPNQRANSSKKSKGKSKKKYKKKKGKLKKKKTISGWCLVRPSDSDYSSKGKKKSKKNRIYIFERERVLKKSKFYGVKGFFKGKTMKIKKKKGKGSKKDSPSMPSIYTKSPSIDYGKGKSKKKKNKYPYCDELSTNTSSPSISMSPSQTPSRSSPTDRTNPPTQRPRNPKTRDPTPTPKTRDPTPNPTRNPTPSPTPNPTQNPTPNPTQNPTSAPIPDGSQSPSVSHKPTLEKGIYRYDKGNCPASGAEGVPCAEETNIRKVCNRYDEEFGSFRKCWDICKPAFCCIHDANPALNYLAPSCSKDENCAQYAYCYIVWFKFHDTFGPATFLNVEQEGNFFDVDNDEVRGDKNLGDEFFDQLYFHHFDDVDEALDKGRNPAGDFELDEFFENDKYWDMSF